MGYVCVPVPYALIPLLDRPISLLDGPIPLLDRPQTGLAAVVRAHIVLNMRNLLQPS